MVSSSAVSIMKDNLCLYKIHVLLWNKTNIREALPAITKG